MTPEALLPALTLIAFVADETALRSAPSESAPIQLRLARGAWLEPRGEAGAWLKVFDHEHARSGYVRPSSVRVHPWAKSEAPTLATVAGFLRDSNGMESLGVAYATAALKLDPDSPQAPALAEALGTMTNRLARRASQKALTPDQSAALAAELPVAESWGAHFVSFEHEGRSRLCADPDPLRTALGAGDPVTRTRAALLMTSQACLADDTPARVRRAWNEWSAEVLSHASTDDVPSYLAQRVRLRRAEIAGELAFVLRNDAPESRAAATRAAEALLAVDGAKLATEDEGWRARATIVASASRWALASASPSSFVSIVPRDDGSTCVRSGEAERCTFGRVWASSLVSDGKRVAAVVVQLVPEISELWVITPSRIDVVAPSTSAYEAGFVEPAGLSPDGSKLLVVRDAIKDGIPSRSFEVLNTADLRPIQRVRTPDDSAAFRRWTSAAWTGSTYVR